MAKNQTEKVSEIFKSAFKDFLFIFVIINENNIEIQMWSKVFAEFKKGRFLKSECVWGGVDI